MTPIRPLLVSTLPWVVWTLSIACTGEEPSGVAQSTSGPGNGGAASAASGGAAGSGASASAGSGGANAGAASGGASSGTGGGAGGNELTGYCGVWVGRLRECVLLGGGRFTGCANLSDAAEACETQCVMAAACADITAYLCGIGDGLLGCFGTCLGEVPVTCLNGETYPFTYHCDGIMDCLEGEDETGCPPGESFRCRNVNERIDATLFCDGTPNCSDASDEPAGCALTFTCSDGEPIPADYACDGFADCLDASDEPADCAQAMCP